MIHRETTRLVIRAFYDVYNGLGTGFLEHVYENALVVSLRGMGVDVVQQGRVDVFFRGVVVGEYRADLLIPGKVVLEIKARQELAPIHDAQLINYLKATSIPVGMLLNFGPRPAIRRRILANRLIGSYPGKSVVDEDL
ncbi:GxxExxY protein [Arenimonas composti]|uniref:GxxExxY protein n=1 Tax=Arenimonas composti TR7-09 = DSM 18010 TaxID=1121013 RepID=A0A091BB75_9GAMM|nr:GxxExxY protein [Arenimonas composti]KFN48951.1 hypothetical protein P873_01225 [Arenimonas composti TR7-09 = DSM 18010]